MGIEALCESWHARSNNKTHRALGREYAQHFAPTPRRVSKPKPTAAAIEGEVLQILGRKSCVRGHYPWELANDTRDKLGATRTTLPASVVQRVLNTMEKRKRIARIEHGGTGHYSVSYVLAGRR